MSNPISETSIIAKLQNQPKQNGVSLGKKIEVVTLTFLAFVGIHALRTTYSFSKSYLPAEIQVGQQYIGLVDSVMLLFLGIGNFVIALVPITRPILLLWITLILCGSQYGLVPVTMSLVTGFGALGLLLFLMGLSGFLQSFAWPNLLSLVHTVTNPDKDATLLGFWATSANFGNILGFVICQAFVLGLGYSWKIGMFVISLYLIIIGMLIAVRIDEVPEKNYKNPLKQSLLQQNQQQVFEEPKITKIFKSPRVTLLTISFSLFKSVMEGILLWLPVYFHTIGLVDYQLYIPMAFDGASIVGSVFLGAVFKKLQPKNKNSALLPLMVLLTGLFLLLRIAELNVVSYFIVIALVGFCLGGSYNTMASLVTMELVRVIPKKMQSKCLRFYSALLMGVACFVTSVTQVIIGMTVEENIDALFGIFLAYTVINFFSLSVVVYIDRQSFSVAEQAELAAIGSKKSLPSLRNYQSEKQTQGTGIKDPKLQYKPASQKKNTEIEIVSNVFQHLPPKPIFPIKEG